MKTTMNKVERTRLCHLLTVPVAATLVAAAASPAHAQPATRGAPIVRTPPPRKAGDAPAAAPARPGTPAAGGAPAGAAPKPATPGAAGAPGTPAAGGGDDPMAAAGVKLGAKEIDFKPKPGGFGVNFNLEDADLPELVKAISNITGKRFIYGGKLRQIKATVYSPEKVSAQEAYSAFLSILETNGMTVIPHGRFLKIVESPGVVTDTTEVFGTAAPIPNEDRYITRLYRVSHIDATETANLLTKFKTKEGDITVYPAGNLLIITETGSNIQRMMRILEEIDVGGAGEQLWVEPVHYTSATELANKLNDILDLKGGKGGGAGGAAGQGKGGGGGGAPGARIIADDRGNALIITANEPDYLRLLELIKRLDVKQTGEGEIHVQPLQYAACKDLSTTLNQILGTSGLGGATGARPGAPGVPAAPVGAGATGVRGAAGAGLDEVFEGRVRITCDEATNSLVTTSSLRDYAQLRTVIDKLDRPRRQVFIEAVIMDVSIQRKTDYGISYHGGAPVGFGSLGDGFFYGGNNLAGSAGIPTNIEALALGLRGPDLANSQSLLGTGISIPALGVALHALGQDGDTNVLATPHILATDNTKAEISIGQNIPLQTNVGGGLSQLAGAAAGASGAAGALGSLGGLGLLGGGFSAPRQDVGTKITVTPHVNDSDQVRLELIEEISDAGAPTGALGAIPINKRSANTTLVVRDQQTVVIGGLVRDAVQNGETKIPILGDIPVLGLLFKQTQKTKTKSNLLLVLTPYVIRDQDDLRAIFERKMQERQEFIDRYFVFNESTSWNPPKDYRRANGLVEDIRQALIQQEDKARIEAETKPKAKKTHEPGQPIPLPQIGGRGGDGVEPGAAPAVQPGGAPAVQPRPAGRPPRGQGGAVPAPRMIER
ncbi:General secretion pathway protein D [Minicystis rosea]|nr:General secretion pathway protein D [Minicystis rosea]